MRGVDLHSFKCEKRNPVMGRTGLWYYDVWSLQSSRQKQKSASPSCLRSVPVQSPTAGHWPSSDLSFQRWWWWQWHHDEWLPLGHVNGPSRTLNAQKEMSSENIMKSSTMLEERREWRSRWQNHKSSPVRSRARSGWFMRQWLANFTHSSLTGTWMSLNLWSYIRKFGTL